MPRRRPFVCCVPKCGSQELRNKEEQEYHLYKFPTDKVLMRKWVAVVGRGDNFIPTDRTRICSKHFQTGKRSYKPSSVDFIPSIFWYNTAKVSEFCNGCRRKICKCEQVPKEPEQPLIDIEARIHELLEEETEEAEADAEDQHGYQDGQEEQFDYVDESHIQSQSEDIDPDPGEGIPLTDQHFMTEGDADVTEAIASFLQEEYIPEESEPTRDEEKDQPMEDLASEETGGQIQDLQEQQQPDVPQGPPPIPTAVDETIERVVRWEDCIEIIPRRRWPSSREVACSSSEAAAAESSASASTRNKEGATENMEVDPDPPHQLQVQEQDPEVPEPVTGEMNAPEAGAKDTSTNTPEKLGTLRSQTVSHEPDSELEVEWGRRERRLIRQHKAEEKKILIQMVQNNQAKNQVIDEFKTELKELKRTNKSLELKLESLETKLREEYEAKYKEDVKKILDEANMNLALLQNGWVQEKKVLLEANTALARLAKSEQSSDELMEIETITQISTIPHFPPSSTSTSTENEAGVELMIQNRGKQHLRVENCEDSPDTIKYFTGMPSKYDFDSFYAMLEEKAKNMRYWNGKTWSSALSLEAKRQKTGRIDLKNQLFLTLARYKRGFTTKELGFFFAVDPVFVSCIFITFSKLIESELNDLYLQDYNAGPEFEALPEIVQTHYPKLYAALRITEIRLESRPTFNLNSKAGAKKSPPTFKVLILFTPNGNIFFISSVFPVKTSDRDVILESKVFDMIPAESEVFVDKEFDVSEECIARQLQLHVFPYDLAHALSEDDPWEIKLMTKCKSRMEKLIGLMRYFRIFDNDLHLAGANHTPMVIRVVLLLQYYFDTRCVNYSQILSSTSN